MNRNTSITKRFMAFVVAFAMMVAIMPTNVFAAAVSSGFEVYADLTTSIGQQMTISYTDAEVGIYDGVTVGEIKKSVVFPKAAQDETVEAKVFDPDTYKKSTDFTKTGKSDSALIKDGDLLVVSKITGKTGREVSEYELKIYYTVEDLEALVAEVKAFKKPDSVYRAKYIELDISTLDDALAKAETTLDTETIIELPAFAESVLEDAIEALGVVDKSFTGVQAGVLAIKKPVDNIYSNAADEETILENDTYMSFTDAYEAIRDVKYSKNVSELSDEVSELCDDFSDTVTYLWDYASKLDTTASGDLKTAAAMIKVNAAAIKTKINDPEDGLKVKVGALKDAIAAYKTVRADLSAANYDVMSYVYDGEQSNGGYENLARAYAIIKYASDLKVLLDEYSATYADVDINYEPANKVTAYKAAYANARDATNIREPKNFKTPEVIGFLYTDLKAAAAALTMQADAAETALTQLVKDATTYYRAGNKDDENCTPEVWAAFKKAYEDAVAALMDDSTTGADLNKYYNALTEAVDAFENCYKNLLDALLVEIEEAELDEADYPSALWKTYNTALAYANYVVDTEQSSYKKAYDDLLAAYNALATKDGWIEEDGKWLFYEKGVKANGWRTFTDANGDVKYFFTDGLPMTGWDNTIDGKWRLFNNVNGNLVTGWYEPVAGFKYYFDPANNGVAAMGWLQLEGKWYVFNNVNAIMVTGWAELAPGDWFYFGTDGAAYVGGVFTNPSDNPFDPTATEVEFNAEGKYMGPVASSIMTFQEDESEVIDEAEYTDEVENIDEVEYLDEVAE